jgi:hypothetical protein
MVTALLEERLQRGDYTLRAFPSERRLAEELDVSRLTVRKALGVLTERGLLAARPRGRSTQRAEAGMRVGPPGAMQLAFLMPPAVSYDVQAWQRGIEQAGMGFGAVLRTVMCTAWSDVVVDEVLRSFDGVFVMQMGEALPPAIIEQLCVSETPVVSLNTDLSAHDIPSVMTFPRRCSDALLDHCVRLGHRQIACLNTYALEPVIRDRIEDWQAFQSQHGLSGPLINQPVSLGRGGPDAAQQAYTEVRRLLGANALGATAIYCTAVWAALGAMQAVRDHGQVVGDDISVCCMNDEGMAEWQSPKLTCLRAIDPVSLLAPCVDWIAQRGSHWIGPKLIVPHRVPLYEGQSTGRADAKALKG